MAKEFWEAEVGSDWNRTARMLGADFQTERLLRSPPHVVAAYFEELGRKEPTNPFLGDFRPDEAPLLATGDPLIRLALARWGTDSDVLRQVINEFGPGSPERLAACQNVTALRDYNYTLFEADPEIYSIGYLGFLKASARRERQAVAGNPAIDENALRLTLEALMDDFTDQNREIMADILFSLPSNAVLGREYFDGSHWHDGIRLKETLWSLASCLPTAPPLVFGLSILYRVMMSSKGETGFVRTEGVPEKEALNEAIHKWASASAEAETTIYLGYKKRSRLSPCTRRAFGRESAAARMLG